MREIRSIQCLWKRRDFVYRIKLLNGARRVRGSTGVFHLKVRSFLSYSFSQMP